MGLIRGVRVDLESPCPPGLLPLAYHWVHACPDLTEDDDSPPTPAAWESAMGLHLIGCVSYGLRPAGGPDVWIGLLYFEPSGPRNGYLHIAMPRHAWGHGLADEAASLAIRDLFLRFPDLTRLSVAILENNRSAQALARRMGFRFEAALPDMVVQRGRPRAVAHYGLTRREWNRSLPARPTPETRSSLWVEQSPPRGA
jgi:RimJ/RimL family protein N-acetyltransferase